MRSTTNRPEPRKVALALGLAIPAALAAWLLYPAEPPADAPPPSAPAPVAPPPAAVSAPPPPAPPSTDGLVLHGVLGRGAIIEVPGGGQRLIGIGRDVVPGLRLQEVGLHRAVLGWSAGTVELTLAGRADDAGRAVATPARASNPAADARREETLRYRLGLAPRRSGGRITGFAIRPGAELPALRRAGLRPGDVIVSVNGQTFDSEERVLELAGEIAGSFTAEFEFERGGRRMRAELEINPRT